MSAELPPQKPEPEPEPEPLPLWIPVMIGVVLMVMAALAIYTGVRYRESPNTLTTIVKPRRVNAPAPAAAPPGEPQPGASLVFPGDDAGNTPNANAPVTGRARAEITGGGTGGVQTTLRLTARRGMIMSVVPGEAMVYVNELPIGQANQFDKPDEVYDFPAPGSYTIRISAPGFRDRQFIVTVAENASAEVAKIDAALVKE
ncbi:MAG TPA: hypothetical protein VII75_05460 [Thermoanaerobaculia bacterium]|nr:hypothetical protein [Thermoanaerobaculia bacterium]